MNVFFYNVRNNCHKYYCLLLLRLTKLISIFGHKMHVVVFYDLFCTHPIFVISIVYKAWFPHFFKQFLIDRALYIIHEASFATLFFFSVPFYCQHTFTYLIYYIYLHIAQCKKSTHTQASVKTFFRILRRESRITFPILQWPIKSFYVRSLHKKNIPPKETWWIFWTKRFGARNWFRTVFIEPARDRPVFICPRRIKTFVIFAIVLVYYL